MLCDYGCDEKAKYKLKNGKNCCQKHYSSCRSVKEKNSLGVKSAYKKGTRKSAKIIYNNLPQETKDRMAWARGKTFTENVDVFTDFSMHGNMFIKKRIIQENLIEYKCHRCDVTEWFGEKITLDLDHINGNNRDNRLENLRFLCPNCHSLTSTYKGRGKNIGTVKVSDEELIAAYKSEGNIRKTLLKVGLSAKGGNYARVKQLIAKFNI